MVYKHSVLIIPCLSLAALMNMHVHAETLYYEDFSKGHDTLRPWQSVWQSRGTATADGLLYRGNGAMMITRNPAVQDLSSVSIRSQVSFDGTNAGGIGLLSNGDPINLTAYQAGINPIANRLYIGANVDGAYRGLIVEEDVEFDLQSGEEVVLQFDVDGNELALWAWRPGEPMPDEPRLTYIDEEIEFGPGVPGVLFDARGTDSTATYRYIHVASRSIPEPSSPILGGFGVIGVFLLCRRWN